MSCRQCVEAVQPGATLRQLHQLSVRLLCQGLRDLGVMQVKLLAFFPSFLLSFFPSFLLSFLVPSLFC